MELPISGHRRTSYTIQANNLSCAHHQRFIIQNVSLEARPGEITAVAGPSGAGKTTLLEILAGAIPSGKVSGEVLVNGNPMDSERFGRLSGYVTQDDALFPLLTVEETLTYSALLRLPAGKREARQRVKLLMKDLGLDHISASRVGQGSISGGERRRLSIGVELIHDPTVLLIDEPTSGLDSASALHIVSLLRSMAVTQCKTIILTIHQPGFRILELIDRLLLLSGGRILHNGSLQSLEERLSFSGHRIPSHINVLEFAIEVTNNIDLQEIGDRDHSISTDTRKKTKKKKKKSRRGSSSYANSRLEEVVILGERFSKNIFRTRELFATRVAQAVVVGSILGTVYMKVRDEDGGKAALQTRLGFFAFTLSFLLSSTTEGLPIFLQERRIFMRETVRGAYRVSSYVAANTLVFVPFLMAVAVLYSGPAYWLVGLRSDAGGFLYFALVVWLVVLMSNSFTACCSALVPDFIMGTSLIAGLMGSFFLFSGYFIAQESIPDYWIFMHYLSMFKYPFECLVINEYGGRECVERVGGTGQCVLSGDEYLRQQGLKQSHRWSNLGVMLGFVLGYRLLCFFILWCRSFKTTKC
ncbi:ABC transporter G family member 10-like [Salvia miltiorrhiza]|uniref:ABC transporter G family member 10-like n=1 Tax=Salvia miltiorrhiza TaxID=226208 RepID=UPI0025AC1B5A|nr:ABC transporter G family member 10-like [Salvia miltiorrhiza]